jgi:hypothetical protein
MKIALLGPAPPFRGGISLFASHLGNEFANQGHELCFFNFRQQYPPILFTAGKQTEDIKFNHPTRRILTPYLPHTWAPTAKAINEFKPDITIVSWWLPFFGPAYAYILGRLKHGRKVILAHNVEPHEEWLGTRMLLRSVFSKADEIVVLSKSCLLELKRNLPSSIVRKAILGFHPIYDTYGGDTAKTNALPCILFFGMIKAYKGAWMCFWMPCPSSEWRFGYSLGYRRCGVKGSSRLRRENPSAGSFRSGGNTFPLYQR